MLEKIHSLWKDRGPLLLVMTFLIEDGALLRAMRGPIEGGTCSY